MKVEEILKGITPEVRKREIEKIQKVKLPAELQEWVKEYEKVGDRDERVWIFTYKIIKEISYFIVCDKKYSESLNKIKFLFSMLVITIDDIADKEKSDKLLNELSELFFYKRKKTKKLDGVPMFVLRVFRCIEQEINKYPFFINFEKILYFEIVQIFNSMRFAILVNKHPFMMSRIDYWNYFPCTMQIMAHGILELMCANRKFEEKELKEIRDFFSVVQKMGRIGNWISTWEREIYENDFSSLFFVYAVDYNIIDINNMEKMNKLRVVKEIKRLNIEKELIKKWCEYYQEIYNNKKDIKKIINTERLFPRLKKSLILQIIFKS